MTRKRMGDKMGMDDDAMQYCCMQGMKYMKEEQYEHDE